MVLGVEVDYIEIVRKRVTDIHAGAVLVLGQLVVRSTAAAHSITQVSDSKLLSELLLADLCMISLDGPIKDVVIL